MKKNDSGHAQPRRDKPADRREIDGEGGKKNGISNDDFGASQQPGIDRRQQHLDADFDMLENGIAAARYLKRVGTSPTLH